MSEVIQDTMQYHLWVNIIDSSLIKIVEQFHWLASFKIGEATGEVIDDSPLITDGHNETRDFDNGQIQKGLVIGGDVGK